MKKTLIEKTANNLVKAFLENKIISPIPTKFTKSLAQAQKLRKLCEKKINLPIIGFKAAGTGIPLMKKFGEKQPFYTSVFKKNVLKSGAKVKINKATLGIELEVCFLINKKIFFSNNIVSKNNIKKYILYIAPCIEIVGYRQNKKGIKSFGDLCSDFGANIKFLVGRKKFFKKINVSNLKTIIENKKIKQIVRGNTNTVYINPLNSLKFVLNQIKKDKINLSKDFWVFTGSTIGVTPILGNGEYKGKIDKIGSVKTIIA